jgi:hypothetical protein
MTKFETFTYTFDKASDAIDAFDLRKLPTACNSRWVGTSYSDCGKKLQIFATQHFGDRSTFTFSEAVGR